MSNCDICNGEGWVCENHRDVAWQGGDAPCCGGAGSLCVCNLDMHLTGFEGGVITHSFFEIPPHLRAN